MGAIESNCTTRMGVQFSPSAMATRMGAILMKK